MQIFKWYDEQNSKAQTNNINISNHFFKWVLLYSHVADFALRKTFLKDHTCVLVLYLLVLWSKYLREFLSGLDWGKRQSCFYAP